MSRLVKRLGRRAWESPALNTWASLGARSLGLVLVLPLVLRRFRPEEVALWQVFSTLIGMQMLADLGFGITGSRVLAYAMGGAADLAHGVAPANASGRPEPNWSLMSQVLSTLGLIYSRLGVLVLVALSVGGTLALLQPVSRLGQGPGALLPTATSMPQAWAAWLAILLTTYFNFRANLFSAFLQGINEVAALRRAETWFALGGITSSFLVLWLRGGLLALVLSNQVWTLLNALWNRQLARHVLAGRFAQFPPPHMHEDVLAAVWPRAWRSSIGAIMSQGLMQASGLIYAQHRDSSAVATYLLGVRLMQTLSQAAYAPFHSKLPAMARLYAEGNTESLIGYARRGMTMTYWSFALPLVILGALGSWLMTRIGSQVPFPSHTLWFLLGVAAFAERYGAMHIQLYSTTNHIVWHIANGVAGSLFVITSICLYPSLGVLALPIGMLAGNVLFYCPYATVHSYSRFAMKFPWFDLKAMGGPLGLILIGWVLGCVMH